MIAEIGENCGAGRWINFCSYFYALHYVQCTNFVQRDGALQSGRPKGMGRSKKWKKM
jgi:hypothetical protein